MRLIDADAFKADVLSGLYIYLQENKEDIARAIDNAPTLPLPDFKEGYKQAIKDGKTNFSRPQGEWLTFPTNHSIIQCPECTALINNLRVDVFKDKVGKMNYCPNCGAKMENEKIDF